jgi:hypothetical protein
MNNFNQIELNEHVNDFNHASIDLFDYVRQCMIKVYNKEQLQLYLNEVDAYKRLYEVGMSFSRDYPINKFCMTILPHAEIIYKRDENFILNTQRGQYDLGNEFSKRASKEKSILDSEKFKDMWRLLDPNIPSHQQMRNNIMDKFINLTYQAQEYFIKTYSKIQFN